MKTAKAFAPGNISCIFSIVKNKDPLKSGSMGVGFTVNEGVLVSIKKINNKKNKIIFNKNKIKFNNKIINFSTINSVIKKLTKNNVEVNISSKLPLGCGFGISGASSLATAYALNRLFNIKKSKIELAKIAHVSEVENGTGLGDVANQHYGGFLVKFRPSYSFKVKKLRIDNKKIYYKILGRLDTKKIISNKKIESRIDESCLVSLKKIKKLIDDKKTNKKDLLKNIIKISKEFSTNSGLINKNLLKLIKNIEKNKGNATMIMLGNALFSDKYFKGSKKLVIKDKGAYLL
jgi:pantoate kinase|tara:strand:+ start:481 stop:1350 length:870 start_codon:yes stop_codon:yes gene_type:complete